MWFVPLHEGSSVLSFHSLYCRIGSSRACSLSEALKVNSSLTQLDLCVSLLIDDY